MGLRGTAADLQLAFDILVEKGEIAAPAQPIHICNREELSKMTAAECKAALEQMGFTNG